METSEWRFGMVFSEWGVGGILAAAITPRLLRRHTTGWVTLAFLPVSAIAGITVTLARHWLLATALMIVWGIAYQVVIINSISYRQQVTPEHLLSRVNTAGRMLSFGVGWTGGALVAGALARVLDVGEVMLAMVCAGVVAAAYAWMSGVRTVAAEPGEP